MSSSSLPTSSSTASSSSSSSSSDSEKDTDRRRRSRGKGVLEAGVKVERKVVEKLPVDGAKHDEERVFHEKKGSEGIRKDEKIDERRPKREREEPARRDRYSERRFREVKERDSSRERREKERGSSRERLDKVRERDIKERDSSRERREREFPRELKERGRDFSRSLRRPSDRWRGDDQDQDRGYGRGRGRRFSGPGRQVWTSRYNVEDRYPQQGWKDGGDRDSYPRRQRNMFQGDKWKHDMFESLENAPESTEPEEDPVAKIEALLAS